MGKTLNLSAGPSVVTSGTLTTLTLTSAGAGGTTITVPSVAALTMARTDAAQTFAGVQSFSNITEFTALTRTLVYRAGAQVTAVGAYGIVNFDTIENAGPNFNTASHAYTCVAPG